jgi:hypothetical protein
VPDGDELLDQRVVRGMQSVLDGAQAADLLGAQTELRASLEQDRDGIAGRECIPQQARARPLTEQAPGKQQ